MTKVIESKCKLAYVTYKAVDSMIDEIEHLPGGVFFWRLLPKKGRSAGHTVRRRLAHLLVKVFFPPCFLNALVKAAVDPVGQIDPRGAELYHWLIGYVYHGDEAEFYADWMRCK